MMYAVGWGVLRSLGRMTSVWAYGVGLGYGVGLRAKDIRFRS
jgi:hypothetical protein